MEELDSDDRLLRADNGRYAERDIVQVTNIIFLYQITYVVYY